LIFNFVTGLKTAAPKEGKKKEHFVGKKENKWTPACGD